MNVFIQARENTPKGIPVAVHAPGVTSRHDRNKVRDAAAALAGPAKARVSFLWETPLFGTKAIIATPHENGVTFDYTIYH